MRTHHFISTIIALGVAAGTLLASATEFDLSWFTIDGGGGTSTSSTFALRGTMGQCDAGSMSGGEFELAGGFWQGGELPVPVDPDLGDPDNEDPPDLVPLAPRVFHVYNARPNPFNPMTTIRYDIPTESHVRVEVYSVRGELVDVLIDEEVGVGRHSVTWDGRDRRGFPAGNGIYVVRTIAGQITSRQKITLLK